jgi:hypothetical protein
MDNEEDSLEVFQNENGTFTMEWDREDPKWAFLNELTTEEIQSIIERGLKEFN